MSIISQTSMPQLVFLLSSLLCVAYCLIRSPSLPIRLPNNPLNTSCPLHRDYDAVREQVREILDDYHKDGNQPCSCGGEGWTRVVHLNMSDMNQQCPNKWTLITTPVRGCGRTNNNQRVCDSVTYPVHGRTYSHVCGRILAYQKGWASAFRNSIVYSLNTIEQAYLSGVSLTHGPPGSRQHIWSFVRGLFDQDDGGSNFNICPCSVAHSTFQVPSFINNNYFCDSGNPGPTSYYKTYYTHNPLWDGQGCGSHSTCCEYNNPPWFCTSLPHPTNEDLEIRSCYTNVMQYENIVIRLMDIYVK